MNPKQIRENQPAAPSKKIPSPPNTGQSDTKEILFLTAGLITLVLGIGGVLMYSEGQEPPVTTASANQAEQNIPHTMAFASSSPTPSSFSAKTVSNDFVLTSSSMPVQTSMSAPEESAPINPADVHFDFNRWALTDTAKTLLKTQVEALPEEWNGTLNIQGHTDARGSDTYNKALGLKRAQAVKTYMVSLGIAEDTVQIETMGKEGPVCVENTPTCFEQNRRAHLAFLPTSFTGENDKQVAQSSPIQNASLETDAPPLSQDLASSDPPQESSVTEETSAEFISADPLMTAESQR